MSAEYTKPLPRPHAQDLPYWEALKKRELRMQKCRDCGHIWHPPAFGCPKCLSVNYDWAKLSGKGKVWTWSVFHYVYYKSFVPDIPYNVIQVKLEEGPIMISSMVECKNEELKCDMPVEIVFDDVTESVTLPRFKPIR
jgi:hypothetical protein